MVAVVFEHVVFAACEFFCQIAEESLKSVVVCFDFAEEDLAVEVEVSGLRFDDDDACVAGVARDHAKAELFVPAQEREDSTSMAVWYPPIPIGARQLLKLTKSYTFKYTRTTFIIIIPFKRHSLFSAQLPSPPFMSELGVMRGNSWRVGGGCPQIYCKLSMALRQGSSSQKVDFLINFSNPKPGRYRHASFKSQPKQIERPTTNIIHRQRTQILKSTFYQMSRWKGKRSHCGGRGSVGSRSSKGCPQTSYDNKQREREEVMSHIKQEMAVRSRPDSHDSFSNYLVRKQRIFKNGFSAIVIKRREKMEFTDLDEMAGKMASAKKLERKIEHDEKKIEQRKIKLRNFEQLHYFHKDYDSPNKAKFYDYGRESEDRENPNIELPTFKDSKKSGRSLIKRNRSEIPARGSDQNLNPWKQNEQQYFLHRFRECRPFFKANYPNLEEIMH